MLNVRDVKVRDTDSAFTAPNPNAIDITSLEIRRTMFRNIRALSAFSFDGGGTLSLYNNCFQHNNFAYDIAFFVRRGQNIDIGGSNSVFENIVPNTTSWHSNGCQGLMVFNASPTYRGWMHGAGGIDLDSQECHPFVQSRWKCRA